MAGFGEVHLDWLRELRPFDHGAPNLDTASRLGADGAASDQPGRSCDLCTAEVDGGSTGRLDQARDGFSPLQCPRTGAGARRMDVGLSGTQLATVKRETCALLTTTGRKMAQNPQ